MREFDLTFDDIFTNGLRKEENVPINTQVLVELKNAKPGKAGLEALEEIASPGNFTIINDWPFPQYFRHQTVELMGERTRLREYDGGLVMAAHQLDVGADDVPWTIADFVDYQVAVKGSGTVWRRNPVTGAWLIVTSIPPCTTVINLNGQIVVGDLAAWEDWTNLDSSYVAWSNIGDATFELDHKNESGFRRGHWFGNIVEVKQLGNNAVVYGHNGIGMLFPVSSPAATFGYKVVADFGVYDKGSVGGDEKGHVFVTVDGELWKLSEEGLQKLGYKEYIEPLLTDYVMVSFDSKGRDFYISNGVRGYLLNDYGMAETYQRVTSLSRVDGEVVGVVDDSGDAEFLAVTNEFDIGIIGQKTTEMLEVGCEGSGQFSVAVDWKMNFADAWERTDWVELNDAGAAALRCAGTRFRIALKCDSYEGVKVSYIKLRYKMTDQRSMRGVYAPPTSWRGQK